jgi:hypothetical protein
MTFLNADHWYKLAAEAHALAETMTDDGPRRLMTEIAATYLRIAVEVERRSEHRDLSAARTSPTDRGSCVR